MVTIESLAIEEMSYAERMTLARSIVETVPVEHREKHSSAWLKQFLQERLKDCEENPDDFITYEEFVANQVARFGS